MITLSPPRKRPSFGCPDHRPASPPLTARDGPLPAGAFRVYTQRMLEAVYALAVHRRSRAWSIPAGMVHELGFECRLMTRVPCCGEETNHCTRFHPAARDCMRSNLARPCAGTNMGPVLAGLSASPGQGRRPCLSNPSHPSGKHRQLKTGPHGSCAFGM